MTQIRAILLVPLTEMINKDVVPFSLSSMISCLRWMENKSTTFIMAWTFARNIKLRSVVTAPNKRKQKIWRKPWSGTLQKIKVISLTMEGVTTGVLMIMLIISWWREVLRNGRLHTKISLESSQDLLKETLLKYSKRVMVVKMKLNTKAKEAINI